MRVANANWITFQNQNFKLSQFQISFAPFWWVWILNFMLHVGVLFQSNNLILRAAISHYELNTLRILVNRILSFWVESFSYLMRSIMLEQFVCFRSILRCGKNNSDTQIAPLSCESTNEWFSMFFQSNNSRSSNRKLNKIIDIITTSVEQRAHEDAKCLSSAAHSTIFLPHFNSIPLQYI